MIDSWYKITARNGVTTPGTSRAVDYILYKLEKICVRQVELDR